MHTKEYPYSCKLCKKKFIQKVHLQCHQKRCNKDTKVKALQEKVLSRKHKQRGCNLAQDKTALKSKEKDKDGASDSSSLLTYLSELDLYSLEPMTACQKADPTVFRLVAMRLGR